MMITKSSDITSNNFFQKRLSLLIVHYGSSSRIYGTSERIFQIAKGLGSCGVNVILADTIQHSVKIENHLNNVHIVKAPKKSNIFDVIHWMCEIIVFSIRYRRYDVIQLEGFSIVRNLLLLLFLRPFGRRFVTVFHDKYWEQDPRRGLHNKMELLIQRTLLRIYDVVITPGDSIKNWFLSLHGKQFRSKIIVIPNGVPLRNTSTNLFPKTLQTRKKWSIRPDAFIACFFGSMTFKPNYDSAMYLYNISSTISDLFQKDTGKRLCFIIAGIGSEGLPMSDVFISLGFVKNLDELFSLSDVIVLPHLPSYSGPHIKTIYSLFSGRPVIASEDAVKDMPGILNGKHFILFDINDKRSLLTAFKKMYYDKILRKRIIADAKLYCRKFSWEYLSSLHLRLYRNLFKS